MAMNWEGGLGGAGTGAIYGAQFGGPIGGAIGAGIGGLAGLFNKKKKPKQLSTFDPQQQELYKNYMTALQGGGGPLGDIFGQFDPEQIRKLYTQQYAQPAYQQFNQEVVPGITGQFRGGNLQNSSYLGGALAKAGSDVQNNLNGNLGQMLYQAQQAQINRRQQGIGSMLGQSTFGYQQPQSSVFDNLLSGLSTGASDLLAQRFNRPTPSMGG